MTPLRNGTFWSDAAPDAVPVMPMPWALRVTLVLGALVWVLAIIGARSLFGQVATTLTLTHGDAITTVANPARDPQAVTVSLWRSLTDSTAPAVLVSPVAFALAPGDAQTVRLRAREACSALWRWVVRFDPAADTGPARVRIALSTRIVAKVACA